jgi:hypothetical protein
VVVVGGSVWYATVFIWPLELLYTATTWEADCSIRSTVSPWAAAALFNSLALGRRGV